MKHIDNIIAWFISIPVSIGIMLLAPSIIENVIRYGEEGMQFVEDFSDMRELGQEMYYFNFDPVTMIYMTDESYDYIHEMWNTCDK